MGASPLEEKDEIPRMVDALLPADEAPAHDWNAPSGLLDALQERAPEAKAATEDDEDLLAALTQDGPQTASSAFSVDLGEEREVRADEDGVAEVLLRPRWRAHLSKVWPTRGARPTGVKSAPRRGCCCGCLTGPIDLSSGSATPTADGRWTACTSGSSTRVQPREVEGRPFRPQAMPNAIPALQPPSTNRCSVTLPEALSAFHEAELARQSAEVLEIPCIINGEEVWTGNVVEQVMPTTTPTSWPGCIWPAKPKSSAASMPRWRLRLVVHHAVGSTCCGLSQGR